MEREKYQMLKESNQAANLWRLVTLLQLLVTLCQQCPWRPQVRNSLKLQHIIIWGVFFDPCINLQNISSILAFSFNLSSFFDLLLSLAPILFVDVCNSSAVFYWKESTIDQTKNSYFLRLNLFHSALVRVI